MVKTMGEFLDYCNNECFTLHARVVKAVISKLGGWDRFKETAQDVVNHGASGGFSNFTYYADTCKFYAAYQPEIVAMATAMAEDFGESVVEMVNNFVCLGKDYTVDEIGKTLYGSEGKHETIVANALAWFALEEVCRAYVDATEE